MHNNFGTVVRYFFGLKTTEYLSGKILCWHTTEFPCKLVSMTLLDY